MPVISLKYSALQFKAARAMRHCNPVKIIKQECGIPKQSRKMPIAITFSKWYLTLQNRSAVMTKSELGIVKRALHDMYGVLQDLKSVVSADGDSELASGLKELLFEIEALLELIDVRLFP